MIVSIKKGTLCGTAFAPPSKSYAHRLLLGAAFCENEVTVRGISGSEDMSATLDCLRALGVDFKVSGDTVIFGSEKTNTERPVFNCRDSGSTLRFFIPIACVLCGGGRFCGSARLIERGIGIYEEIFKGCGISVSKNETAIDINGFLSAGEYTLRGDISSQFITGLLFALSLLAEDSIINVIPPFESRKYIDITIQSMAQFGVKVEKLSDLTFKIKGGQSYIAYDAKAEGDWSNAAFLYALNAVGSDVAVEGLNQNSLQGDRCCLDYFEALKRGGDILDISQCPDLGPVLFSVAAAVGEGHFVGTRRLKIKESDRAAVMQAELSKLGAEMQIGENSVDIYCKKLTAPQEKLCGHNDHRIVMALSVLLTLTGGEIKGAEAVNKSYPDFFEVLEKLGLEVSYDT